MAIGDFSSQLTNPPPTSAFEQGVFVGENWARISSATTTQVKSGSGQLIGVIVASSTSGTLLVYDDTASTTIAINTMTPALGWNPLPVPFKKGLRITSGGTIDCTVIYN